MHYAVRVKVEILQIPEDQNLRPVPMSDYGSEHHLIDTTNLAVARDCADALIVGVAALQRVAGAAYAHCVDANSFGKENPYAPF